ncbi:MAG: potassium-transporting ATPase subunit F [Bacteroidota bacterium]
MTLLYILASGVTLALLGYLIVALLKPEIFP